MTGVQTCALPILLRVRAFCRRLARPVLSEQDTARLVLAADEAMSNIVRHGGGRGEPVEIVGTPTADKVLVEFRYSGHEFQPPAHLELPPDSEPPPEGGYGLYIIDRSADQVEYYRDGDDNCIRLVVEVRSSDG